jgi:hypothetical protein
LCPPMHRNVRTFLCGRDDAFVTLAFLCNSQQSTRFPLWYGAGRLAYVECGPWGIAVQVYKTRQYNRLFNSM